MAVKETEAATAAAVQEPELLFLSAGPTEDILSLTWSRGGEQMSLVRGETGAWERADDAEYPRHGGRGNDGGVPE